MLTVLPIIHLVEELPPDLLHAQHVAVSLKYHHTEDDKFLDVPEVLVDSNHIYGQRTDKMPSHLNYRRVVPLQ